MPNHGKHKTFIALYEEHKDGLFNYLMYRLNFNRTLAEDLLMDVILKAYEHFDRFDQSKGSFSVWIFTIARNHLTNHWRDDKKTISLEAMEEDGIVVAKTQMEENVSAHMTQKAVRHVLSLLRTPEREVIILRYLHDLSYDEIAQTTGGKEGAIRTSLCRALDRFESLYKKIYG